MLLQNFSPAIRLNLCALFLFATAPAGELFLRNGDRIALDAPGVEGGVVSGRPPWEGPGIQIPVEYIQRWQTRAEPPGIISGRVWLGLRDGSTLLASGLTLHEGLLRWTSSWGEEVLLPLDQLWTLTPVPQPREDVPEDLLNPEDWQFTGSTEEPPHRVGMELHIPGPRHFTMFRELPLAEPVRVDLRLRFDASDPHYLVGFHIPRQGQLGRGSLRVITGPERTRLNHDLGGMNQPEDTLLPFQPNRHRTHHIRIHSDWGSGRFELWMNGVLYRKWFRPNEPPEVPPWVGFAFYEGHPVVIESFTISPWDGLHPAGDAEEIPPDSWHVLLRNGDELTGEIVSLDAAHLQLRMSGNHEVPLPLTVIQDLRTTAPVAPPESSMELILHGGQRLRGDVEDWGTDNLRLRQPGASTAWQIPRVHLASILFRSGQAPPAADFSHTVHYRSGHRLRGSLNTLSQSTVFLTPWFGQTSWEIPLDRVDALERAGDQTHTDGDRVRFVNGDFLRGALAESPEAAPLLDHPRLGRLRLRPESVLAAEGEADGFWVDSFAPPGRWQVVVPSDADADFLTETSAGFDPGHAQLNHALPVLPDQLRLRLQLHSDKSPFFDIHFYNAPPDSAERNAPLRISASNARPRLEGDPPGPVMQPSFRENYKILYLFEFDFITHEVFLISEDQKRSMGTFPELETREGFWFSFQSRHPAFRIVDLQLEPAFFPPPPDPVEIPGKARIHFAEGGQRVILSDWREEDGTLFLRSPLWEGEAALDPQRIHRWEMTGDEEMTSDE